MNGRTFSNIWASRRPFRGTGGGCLLALLLALPAAGQTQPATQAPPGQPPLGDPFGLGGQPPQQGGTGSPFWGGNGGEGNGSLPIGEYPAAQVDRVPQALALVQRLEWTRLTLRQDLSRRIAEKQREFERREDVVAATERERTAWQDYQSARQDVLARLLDDPDYAAAAKLTAQLDRQLDSLHRRDAAPSVRQPVAEAKLSYARTMSEMETAALAANGEADSARRRYLEAGAQLADLQQQQARALEGDEELAQIRQSLRQLRIEYLTAVEYARGLIDAADIAVDYQAFTLRNNRFRPVYGFGGYGNFGGFYGGYGYGGVVGFPQLGPGVVPGVTFTPYDRGHLVR